MKKNEANKTIEESFKELDKIIEEMDSDKCSIEKSIELYEKGSKLLLEVDKRVEKIEKDIEIIEEK